MTIEIDGHKTDDVHFLDEVVKLEYYTLDYVEFIENIIDGDVKVLKTDLNDKKKIITEYLYDNEILG